MGTMAASHVPWASRLPIPRPTTRAGTIRPPPPPNSPDRTPAATPTSTTLARSPPRRRTAPSPGAWWSFTPEGWPGSGTASPAVAPQRTHGREHLLPVGELDDVAVGVDQGADGADVLGDVAGRPVQAAELAPPLG